MSSVKVSVIIPFFNGQDYVDTTINSLKHQTLKEIEIICVDDGSTDETYSRLQEIAKDDKRITVIKQQKSNAGAARNKGFQYASGEYLLFLDSDDLYEKRLLERMYEECVGKNADVCVCDADQYDVVKKEYIKKPQYLRVNLLPEKMPFSKESIGKHILYFTTSVPWNKMIRTQFVKKYNLLFQEIDRANDQFFSIMVLLLAERITVVKEKLVHYCVNQDKNLTANYSDTPLCSYEAMHKVKEELDRRNMLADNNIRCAFDNKILNLLLYSLNIQRSFSGFCELYKVMKTEGFTNLGFLLHEETYYFNSMEYRNLTYIMEHSPEEYLLIKNQEYRETIGRKNKMVREQKAEIKELEKKIAGLVKKEKELNHIKSTKRYKIIWKISGLWSRIIRKRKR